MQKHLFYISLLFVFSLFMNACTNQKGSLPASSGKTAEVLFVIDNPNWEGTLGDTIKFIFNAEYMVLNQPEPLFSLAHIEERSFTSIFESHRNIIIVDTDPKHTKKIIEVRKDVWSQPQLVIKLMAPNENEMLNLITEKSATIIDLLYENERTRMIKAFKRDEDIILGNAIDKAFGVHMTIPKGYFIAKQTKDFCWIRRETEETSMGLLLYFYPYTDTLSFNTDYILSLRDSLTQMHIPGPSDGSYAQVSHEVVLPIAYKTPFLNRYAVNIKGLWEVEGNFMGGPFINYTFVDTVKNRVVTLDGFVYAPRFPKRDYMIQLDAILHTYKETQAK